MKWGRCFIHNGLKHWRYMPSGYSFLIGEDKEGFVCSYKSFATPEKVETIFKGVLEFNGQIGDTAPVSYYFNSLEEAQKACEDKYKKLVYDAED